MCCYASTVLLVMPAANDLPAPLLATGVGLALTIAALLNIVVAISDSVRATDIGAIVGALTDQAVAVIHRHLPDPDEGSAIRQLGVALREIYSRRLPERLHADGPRRWVHLDGQFGYADYLERSFTQLREAGEMTPSVAITMLDVLARLRGDLLWVRRDARLDAIEQEAARVLESLYHADPAPSGIRRVEGFLDGLDLGDTRPARPTAPEQARP